MNNNDDALIDKVAYKLFMAYDSGTRALKFDDIEKAKEIIEICQHDKTDWVSVDKALDLLSSDMHTFGIRPCSTCAVVSEAIGKPFGCSTRNGHRIPSPPKENS